MSAKMDNKLYIYKFRLALREIVRSLSKLHLLAKQNGLKPDIASAINHYGSITRTYVGYRSGSIENIPLLMKELNSLGAKNTSRIDKKKRESIKYFNSEVSEKIGKYVSYNVAASNDHSKCGVFLNKNGNIEKIVIHTMHENHARYIGSLGSNKVVVYAAPFKHDKFQCWKSCYLTYHYSNGNRVVKHVDCFIMKEPSSNITYYHVDYRLCAEGMRRAIGRSITKRIGG